MRIAFREIQFNAKLYTAHSLQESLASSTPVDSPEVYVFLDTVIETNVNFLASQHKMVPSRDWLKFKKW